MSSPNEISEARQGELQALIDSSPLALVEFGPDTRIRLWNPAAERIFGWTAEEMLGRGGLPMAPPPGARRARTCSSACSPASRSTTTRPCACARTGRSSRSRSPPPRSGTVPAVWSATWSPTPTSPSARRRRSWSIASTPSSAPGSRTSPRRARGSSPPGTSSGAGSSATSTTARSSGWSRSRWRCGSRQAKLDDDPAAARATLAKAGDELALALAELRELARGLHPAVLTDRGLRAAVEMLAGRSPVPVEIADDP